MRYILCMLLGICFIKAVAAQENTDPEKFIPGISGGIGVSYTDKALLVNLQGSFTLDYYLTSKLSIQFAPGYTWLIRWNEHYLTIPLQLKMRLSDKLSVSAGPALTFDAGYFHNTGISAGVYYHFSKRSGIKISVYTFTLYNYHIDYLFVPLGLNYTYTFIK